MKIFSYCVHNVQCERALEVPTLYLQPIHLNGRLELLSFFYVFYELTFVWYGLVWLVQHFVFCNLKCVNGLNWIVVVRKSKAHCSIVHFLRIEKCNNGWRFRLQTTTDPCNNNRNLWSSCSGLATCVKPVKSSEHKSTQSSHRFVLTTREYNSELNFQAFSTCKWFEKKRFKGFPPISDPRTLIIPKQLTSILSGFLYDYFITVWQIQHKKYKKLSFDHLFDSFFTFPTKISQLSSCLCSKRIGSDRIQCIFP